MQDLRLLVFAVRISCVPQFSYRGPYWSRKKIHQYVRTATCKLEFHIKRGKSHRRPNWWCRLTVVTVLFPTSGLLFFLSLATLLLNNAFRFRLGWSDFCAHRID